MIIKGIGATTHLDRHNCKIDKEALEDLVKSVNGEYAIRIGIEHDSLIMPIGKILSGKLIKLEDGEYAVELEQEMFEEYRTYIDASGAIWYIAESNRDTRPYADAKIEKVEKVKIAIDPVNFACDDYDRLLEFYKEECSVDTECIIRKALIPDPEIIITLVTGTMATLVGKKIKEKFVERITEDFSKTYDLLKKIVLETIKYCKQSNRPVTYLVRENGSFLLELAVVTENPNILIEALSNEKMEQIKNTINQFVQNFEIDINKIQCLYDKDEHKWEVNYVATKDGKVIGSEKCYKRTMELNKKVGSGLSVGFIGNVEHSS